ncbi:MAG: hypothetical protein C0409_00735 [Novosphingobium sp.]|nr:hypothetical protein [Novosphingobium sp.]
MEPMMQNDRIKFVVAAAALAVTAAMLPSGLFAAAPHPDATAPADPAVIAAGQALYAANCAECHSISKDGAVIYGPVLWGVVGKKAGTGSEYPYSDALKNSGHVWSAGTLDKWLEGPSDFIPDSAMPFIGIKNPEERAALIAFIEKRSVEE